MTQISHLAAEAARVKHREARRDFSPAHLVARGVSGGLSVARCGAGVTLLALLMAISTPNRVDAALEVNVDGCLGEWGVTVADNNRSTFPAGTTNFSSGSVNVAGSTLYYHLEDQDDQAGARGYLGPEYGGQAYDGEFMGVVIQGSKISIAILTGQRSTNWVSTYSPGDIILQTSLGIFGIEVGGVPGGNGLVTEGDLGITFQLNRYGNTLGAKDSVGNSHANPSSSLPAPQSDQVAGSIWKEPEWLQDPIDPPSDVQMDGQSGTRVGLADYVYTLSCPTGGYTGTQHAVIELSFDAFETGLGTLNSVLWQPGCGNDLLQVDIPESAHAPEPGSMLIWGGIGTCLLGMLYRRRRQTIRAKDA